MTDSLRLFGADRERVLCAAGHPAHGELQTKSFACLHDAYYVFEGRLYVRRRDAETEELAPQLEGDTLMLPRREPSARFEFSGKAEVHTHCEQCDPLVVECEHGERTDHRHVWCEWDLLFDRGKLERVEAVRLETRDSLRKQLLRDGVGVLPDDDRIAKRYMALLRAGRRPGFW